MGNNTSKKEINTDRYNNIAIGEVPPGAVIAKKKYDLLSNKSFGEEKIENGIFEIQKDTDLYAVGDIHGDSLLLKNILVNLAKVANILNDKSIYNSSLSDIRWNINNSSYIIFCGDLIDRSRDTENNFSFQDENADLEIIKTLDRLDKEARNYGGRVLILLGNHEIMNFNKNFRYVSQKGFYEYRNLDFNPGSLWANYIADNSFAAIRINNLLFAHGGFCLNFIRKCKKLNLKGRMIIGIINFAIRTFLENGEYTPELYKMKKLLMSEDSILYCRDFGFDNYNCNDLDEIFSTLLMPPKDSKMIIGHSIQNNINAICDDRIWRIDLGMSRAFDNIQISDLELIEYKLTADNGMEWLIQYLNDIIETFLKNTKQKNNGIIKFNFDTNVFNDVEIITQQSDMRTNNFNTIIDKLITHFIRENKDRHVQLLNKLKEKNILIYPVNYN